MPIRLWSWKYVSENRFTWDDGISSSGLKMSGDEKEAMIAAYREDVAELRMEELHTALPLGEVKIKSSKTGGTTDMLIYPFFEHTCALLKKCGVDTGETLAGLPGEVSGSHGELLCPCGYFRRVSRSYYEAPDEVEEWKQKLAPMNWIFSPFLSIGSLEGYHYQRWRMWKPNSTSYVT